jgi:hypothetical protein
MIARAKEKGEAIDAWRVQSREIRWVMYIWTWMSSGRCVGAYRVAIGGKNGSLADIGDE